MQHKLRLHVVSLPHTQTTSEFCSCAYTQKVAKFCRMMHERGHEVFLYSGEHNEAVCTEHIAVVTDAQQREWWGTVQHERLPSLIWNERLPCWSIPNGKAALEIDRRRQPGDFLCLIGGTCQKPIADALPGMAAVEYGIGYEGVFAKYRCFESHAWRHYIHGLAREGDGRPLDTVIPNYFDPADFPFSVEKDDYYLFLGRLVLRKGAQTAVAATKAIGAKLILAGQGVLHQEPGIVASAEVTLVGDHIKHVGPVGVKERGRLLSRARAVFVPTTYLEPFGGVAVEALICGTPAITTNFGAFPETVEHGCTGFRCNTLSEFVDASIRVRYLSPLVIREKAIARFSLDAIAPQYEEWLERIAATERKEIP